MRITANFECFQRQDRRRRVMAMRNSGHGRKSRDQHIRTKYSDDAHDVRKHLLMIPFGERLPVILGIAKVPRAAEELLAAINAPRRQQFLRANHSQLIAELRPEQILPAVPARERNICRAIKSAARKISDQLRVLIVGMRGDVENAPQLVEAAQFL